jgi:hypothetical protein
MALLSPRFWIALALVAVFAGVNFASYRAGKANVLAAWNVERLEMANATVKASEAARETERLVQKSITKITEAKDEKIASINSRLVNALDGLRNRPERRDSTAASAANCQGSTGADLSVGDSQFLERLAARADTIRAGLEACYAQYDALTVK